MTLSDYGFYNQWHQKHAEMFNVAFTCTQIESARKDLVDLKEVVRCAVMAKSMWREA